MFGYNKSELMGRNINIIVPPPWKEYHNSFISKFKGSKGQSKFMGTTRKLFGHHKQGHAFEIMFELKESRDQDRKREFIGLISAIPQTDERVKVISDSKGDILMVSGSIQKAFGYQASDLIGNNVSMLMPESHAAAHHTYLSRYIETGEGKVIGRQARNLVGKGKGEKMFPIVISVEKMEIQKEIFFVAGLWDATNLTGTVYMNGFGLITSVDDQFWYVNLFL
jgi:two-component system sensor kinase FixL